MKTRFASLLTIVAFSWTISGCSLQSGPEKYLKIRNEKIYVAEVFPDFRKLEDEDSLRTFLQEIQDSNGTLVLGGLGAIKSDSQKLMELREMLASYKIETLMNSSFNEEDWN